MKPKSIDKKKLRHSFKYAFSGIKLCFKDEQNMLIHFTMAILVIIAGFLFRINYIEWIVCLLLIGIVFMMELLNTAIENTCDAVTDKDNQFVKIAKDTAAGAVLMISIISAIIGLIIFVPKIMEVLK